MCHIPNELHTYRRNVKYPTVMSAWTTTATLLLDQTLGRLFPPPSVFLVHEEMHDCGISGSVNPINI